MHVFVCRESLALKFFEFGTEQGHHCRLAFHHSHSACWPRENEIEVKALTGHRVVAGARSVIDCQHELWNRCSGHRFNEASAGSNNSRVFCFRANHETRYVLQEKKRSLVSITGFDKVSDLFRGVCIDDPAELWRMALRTANQSTLICDYADRNAFDSCVAGYHLASVVCLELVQFARVEQAIQYIAHIVRKAMIGRHNVVKIRCRPARCARLSELNSGGQSWWKLGDKLTELSETFFIVLCAEVCDSRYFVVSQRAAKTFAIDDFAYRALDQVRPSKSHE